jgi:hypothetical protein
MFLVLVIVSTCVPPIDVGWDALESGLRKNEARMLNSAAFDFQVSRVSEVEVVKNSYTTGLIKAYYRIGTDDKRWFFRQRSLGATDVVAMSEMQNQPGVKPEYDENQLHIPGEGYIWDNSQASIIHLKPASTPHLLSGIPTDFLGFDFRTRIREELGLDEVDQKLYANQLEMPPLYAVVKEVRRLYPSSLRKTTIDSIECWEFSSPTDTIAVAPRFNFALVRRECSFPLNPDRKKFILTNRGFREVVGGFWVPSDFEMQLFAKPGEDESLKNVHVGTVNYRVDLFKLDQADRNLTHPKFPKGFVISDHVRGVIYRAEEDEINPFGDLIEEGKRVIFKMDKQKADSRWWIYGAVGLVVLIGSIGSWIWRNRS